MPLCVRACVPRVDEQIVWRMRPARGVARAGGLCMAAAVGFSAAAAWCLLSLGSVRNFPAASISPS